jgi:general secretion pathway protein E
MNSDRQPVLPYTFAKRVGAFLESDEQGLQLVYRADMPVNAFSEIRRFTGVPFRCRQVANKDFEQSISLAYEKHSAKTSEIVEHLEGELDLLSLAESVPETEDLLDQVENAPIVRLINAILSQAVNENASDIHIETYEKRLLVRFRVDGVLREVLEPKRALAPLLVSRIKVMARLDIAEKRVPQDGRLSLRLAGREVDVRVSTMPSSYGERVVLRLLDRQEQKLELSALGMTADDLDAFSGALQNPHGIILVTGPTGSGKSTTLYAALRELNDKSRNILTVEDPIEYNIEGIGQTQVNTKADMTFARGLRAILRQDPDVVMVGEIRDSETAGIAIQASLTGHLVLSTLHTNTAVGAITRLQDMSVEPFLVSSSLTAIVAQRLVRVLCPDCKQPHVPDEAEQDFLRIRHIDAQALFRPVGCPQCQGLGYRGRTGIYEVLVMDDTLRTLIHNSAGEEQIRKEIIERGITSIRQDGRKRVLAGVTTVEEVLRVTQED